MEIIQTAHVMITDMECPQCQNGMMRPIGLIMGEFPPMYPHICVSCGFQDKFEKRYPVYTLMSSGEQLKVD